MSEYIDREAVFHAMKMDVRPPFAVVRDFPAADVAPVVRCKDCRWGQMDDLGIMHCHKYHMHKNVDGFCDEGERKEPENENTYSSI